ncbi:ATP-binding protein [Nocardia sp. NPDC050712]|uniref:AAA family ATPase n=1 Tax=Nocardia sp. NPDC050712 TaxID=3155518 RepID=UPI0033D5F407
MDGLLVLVNGLPGAGKTTVGARLARSLNAWFLSKDAVKEALAGSLENAVDVTELGGVAMETIWAMASRAPGNGVIDSWWFKPRDLEFARAGIARSGARRIVEVWCDLPAEVAKSRYAARQRAAIHRDRERLAGSWDRWAAEAEPLGLTPVVLVDTTGTVDYAALAERVQVIAGPG